MKLLEPLIDAATGEVVADSETKLTQRQVRKIAEIHQRSAGRPKRT